MALFTCPLIVCLLAPILIKGQHNYTVAPTTAATMFEAQSICEETYSTQLATILTPKDLNAIQNKSNVNLNDSVWIGYTGTIDGKAQWISGQNAQFLTIQQIESGLNIANPTESQENNVLCDAKTQGYSVHSCNFKHPHCFRKVNIRVEITDTFETDIVFDADIFAPSIVVWENFTYIIGQHQIHKGEMPLLRDAVVETTTWDATTYSDNPHIITNHVHSYPYLNWPWKENAHSSALLFIYFAYTVGEDDLISYDLIGVHLQNMSVLSYTLPFQTAEYVELCLVSDISHVYVLGQGYLYIYKYHSSLKQTFEPVKIVRIIKDDIAACVINLNETFLYVFGSTQDILYKYDINDGAIYMIDEPNLCAYASGRGITLPDGHGYLVGCAISSWITLVFDMETEVFQDTMTIGSDNDEVKTFMPFFRSAQITALTESMVFMMLTENTDVTGTLHFRFYRAFKTYVMYNFEETRNTEHWPSDGLSLTYRITSRCDMAYILTVTNNQTFTVSVYSDTARNTINESVILFGADMYTSGSCSVQYAHAEGLEKSEYHCTSMPIPLKLTLNDNDMKLLTFSVHSSLIDFPGECIDDNINFGGRTEFPLVVPNTFTINLIRCHVSFHIMNTNGIITNGDPFVKLSYSLHPRCFNRSGTSFVIDFKLKSNTSNNTIHQKQVVLNIDDLNMNEMNEENYRINIDNMNSNDELLVIFTSQSIDLIVDEPNLSVKYVVSEELLSELETVLIATASAIVAIIILTIFVCCFLKNRRLAAEVARKEQYTRYVKNPLVLFVGIAEYDADAEEGIDVYCKDLYGIDRDYDNFQRLCSNMNWEFYPKQEAERYDWTQKDVKQFMEEKIEMVQNAIDTSEDDLKNPQKTVTGYDGLICAFSGHGLKNGIITNDYHLIEKTYLHRLATTNHPKIRKIPRIFIFDCCDGSQERSHYPGSNPDDRGKNLKLSDIEITQDDDEMWKCNQDNPDFRLVTIHAANEGFRSKMNSVDGSYLIYEFVKRTIANIETESNHKFVGEIVDKIQEDLHSAGKQQIKATYNNHTRYLKFAPNRENENEQKTESQIVSDNAVNEKEEKELEQGKGGTTAMHNLMETIDSAQRYQIEKDKSNELLSLSSSKSTRL